jgi:hypothetical protein
MENSLLTWLLGLANGLILLLVGIAVRGITAINNKLGAVTVEIEKSKTWQTGHEKQDDERHEHAIAHCTRLEEELIHRDHIASLLVEIRDRLPER